MPCFVCVAWLAGLLGAMKGMFAGGGAAAAAGGGGGGLGGILGGMGAKAGGSSMANLAGAAGPGGAMSVGPPQGIIQQAASHGASGGTLQNMGGRAPAAPEMFAGPPTAAPQTMPVTPGAAPPSVPNQPYGVSQKPEPSWLDNAKGYYDNYREFMDYLPENPDRGLETQGVPRYTPPQTAQAPPPWSQWMERLRGMQASGASRRY